jgi:hypothetical protein
MRSAAKGAEGDLVTWTISKPNTGSYYVVNASDEAWFLQVKDDSARPLLGAAGREQLFASALARNALTSRKPAGAQPKAHF